MDGPDIGNLIDRAHEPELPERRRRKNGPRQDVGVPAMAPSEAAPRFARPPATPELDDIADSFELDEPQAALDAPVPSAAAPAMAPAEVAPDGAAFWRPRVPVGTITLHGVEIPIEADGRPILEPLDGRDLGPGSLSRLVEHFE